jgi:hypothetical protein
MATNMPSRNNYFPNNIIELAIFDFEIPSFENGYHVPKLINIWIPLLDLTKQRYIRFYVSSMERLFRKGDRIIKVKHFGTIFKMSNYKLDFKNGWIKESLENIDFVMSLDQKGAFFNLYMQ